MLSESQCIQKQLGDILTKGILIKYKSRDIVNMLHNLMTMENVFHFLKDMASTSLSLLEDVVGVYLSIVSKEEAPGLISRLEVIASAIKAIRITRV